MEAIVARDNLKKALAQVKRNKGAPGIDAMTVAELTPYLKEHWPAIRAQLLDGTYRPQPVRRVEIPKPAGGTRALGIPTVLDRFIQQAVLQVLQSQWDATFSPSSYGFRPGRSAHQAVARARIDCRGPALGGGYRSGKVLRPGQPRPVDGAGGEAGRRQARAAADPRILDRGGAGRRTGRTDRRGHAARACPWLEQGRTALAAVVEPDAGWAG
jgi:hypothetical protein